MISLSSERFIVCIKVVGKNIKKMFQIIFSKNDGSVFINFPYYKHPNGLVSIVTLKSGTKYPTSSQLTTGGKITSHLVKYTHHPDGNVHFSQDKKVLTKIKKESVPLKNIHGHFFTIMLQGVRDYTETKSNNDYSYSKTKTQRLRHFYSIKSEGLSALKFVGRYYNQNKIAHQIVGEVKGSIVPCQTDTGKKYTGFLIKHPFENSTKDNVILLTCKSFQHWIKLIILH